MKTVVAFLLCVILTLVYFNDPDAAIKVKVAFVLLSTMIWSSFFGFILIALKR